MALSLRAARAVVLWPSSSCILPLRACSSSTSSFPTLTQEQRRLFKPKRKHKPQTIGATRSPVSIVVSQILANKASSLEESSPTAADIELQSIAEDIERLDHELAQNELSQLASVTMRCGGCGTPLQTKDPDNRGYIDPTVLSTAISTVTEPSIKKRSPTAALGPGGVVCRRCSLLAADVAVPLAAGQQPDNDDCQAVFAAIRDLPSATIVVVVDIADIEASTVPNLYELLGPRDYVLVGNKMDQLVPDGRDYIEHWRKMLKRRVMALTGIPSSCVAGLEIVSARSGARIERLVSCLVKPELHNQPTYLVGCTNVGKSSLFNRLLYSDLSKPLARSNVSLATVSLWPGTTIGTLKFPTVAMSEERYEDRMQRLFDLWESQDERFRKEHKEFVSPAADPVGVTFDEDVTVQDQHQGFGTLPTFAFKEGEMQASEYTERVLMDRFVHTTAYNEADYSRKRWCYDTPGFIHAGQITNLLSLEEIAVLRGNHSRLRFLPRTHSMRPGMSLLLGGVARLNYVEGPWPIFFTTFTNLPLHIVKIDQVEAYVAEFASHLAVPSAAGDAKRSRTLPPAVRHEFCFRGSEPVDFKGSADVDVVFGGVGWVALTTTLAQGNAGWEGPRPEFKVDAYFPEHLYCGLRASPLLPRAIRQRGKRIANTCEYKMPANIVRWRYVDGGAKAR